MHAGLHGFSITYTLTKLKFNMHNKMCVSQALNSKVYKIWIICYKIGFGCDMHENIPVNRLETEYEYVNSAMLP